MEESSEIRSSINIIPYLDDTGFSIGVICSPDDSSCLLPNMVSSEFMFKSVDHPLSADLFIIEASSYEYVASVLDYLLFCEYLAGDPYIVVYSRGLSDSTVLEKLAKLPINDLITDQGDTRRIALQIDLVRKLSESKKDAIKNRDVANVAMSTASETGKVLNFVEIAMSASTLDDLCQRLLVQVSKHHEGVTVLVRDEEARSWGVSGHPGSEALKKFMLLSDQRIFTTENLLCVRFDHVVISLMHPPVDEDQLGRLRDYLAQYANIAEARAKSIIAGMGISTNYADLMNTIEVIKMSSSDLKRNVRVIMKDLADKIESKAMTLDLTYDDEKELLSLSAQALDMLENLVAGSDAIERHLFDTASKISRIKTLLETESDKNDSGYDASDEIELF